MAVKIDSKLETWKNRLLDLGKRNRLINYRESKRSTLTIQKPDPYALWESFVQGEKPLEFPFFDDAGPAQEMFQSDPEQTALMICPPEEDALPEGAVRTSQSPAEMQKTLRNLRSKSKMAMEEQGINILYLAFGFMKWTEVSHGRTELTSPLLLVPVRLTVESITSPFVLELTDDEIVLTPALRYQLQSDFGLTLPEYEDDTDLREYLEQIRALVEKNQWTVVEEAALSLFSFLKINMYMDLERNRDKIAENPVVRAISGDPSAVTPIPGELNDYDFDAKIPPEQAFQVVDADSSQQEAILCAKKGLSFVLQGPPGTGKSQTITNIIAECLADGKKVLFVSEKMAALDVVHRRLTAAGLDDFCLVLHSHKANKKELLDQLRRSMELAGKKVRLNDEAMQKLSTLQEDRKKLNQYAEQVFAPVEPLGKSIYEVNGILASLDGFEDVIFKVGDVRGTTQQKLNRYLYVLNTFRDIVSRMTADSRSNPWRGTAVQRVSNELRHDIGARLPVLSQQLGGCAERTAEMFGALSLELPCTLDGLESARQVFACAKHSPLIPGGWMERDELAPLLEMVQTQREEQQQFTDADRTLKEQYALLAHSGVQEEAFCAAEKAIFRPLPVLLEEQQRVEARLNAEPIFLALSEPGSLEHCRKECALAREKVEALRSLEQQSLEDFERPVFEVDHAPMLARYKTEYGSIFKYFKGSYRQDSRTMKACYKFLHGKLTDQVVLAVLAKLQQMDVLREEITAGCPHLLTVFGSMYADLRTDFDRMEQMMQVCGLLLESRACLERMTGIAEQESTAAAGLRESFGAFYTGLDTPWEQVRGALLWAEEFRQVVRDCALNREFVQRICGEQKAVERCAAYEQELDSIRSGMEEDLTWFLSLFEEPQTLRGMELRELGVRVQSCAENLSLLEEWIDFVEAWWACDAESLGGYIEQIEAKQLPAERIVPVFKKRFFRLWLDAVLPEYPAVLSFRRSAQEHTVQEFAQLDRMQFDIAKARIRLKLIESLPLLDKFTNGLDEVGILKRELAKQRRIMPIRKLFREIPNLLLTLKPCLMMSPLSVSLFLESDSYQFDTVIFDEASQVCTENAIGAISRGRQVIITGDSRQLPPTNFFAASTSDADTDYDREEEEDDSGAFESILDEASLLPERTLLWHYRSRHEHLIAFSNAKIYHNNLITFPSNVDRVKDNGVEYIYVKDGFYDRGGRRGNVIEAKRVAELVFEHFRTHPNRSLGVIAFGEVQQQAIEAALREMRMKDQQFEPFFKEDREEPFFVKNLENVQGDERDTILFSIGYAKDAQGVFRMNFGPLSKMGGERRLNVAVTRAKYNIKLVGSILPADIDTDRISSEGPKLLRAYIDFAMHGMEALQKEITESDVTEHDSPFEKAVYDYLERKGYRLATQVGCSGYRIDMAVKHPTLSGRYVLGIECDGAAYHSGRTARERDRLRQDVLEQMGWTIYRIWSTDWIKDPAAEGKRLVEAVEQAIKNCNEPEPAPAELPAAPAEERFVSVEKRPEVKTDDANPYGFARRPHFSLSDSEGGHGGLRTGADCVLKIVEELYPVHYDIICHYMAPMLGNTKATVKVKRQVDEYLKQLGAKVRRRGDFLVPADYQKALPWADNDRKIQHISPDELAAAMLAVQKKSVGMTREMLCTETARAYNFRRMTRNVSAAMEEAFDLLVQYHQVRIVEDKVTAVHG